MANTPKIRFKGFTDDWERRKFSDTFEGLQNNTLSRAELNYENGTTKNIHYGDVLIKFGDYIDVSKVELPFVTDDSKIDKYKNSFLQDGDIVIADTAEDDTVGKCTEVQGSEGLYILSGLHTIPCRPIEKHGAKFLGYYMNSEAYHNQLIPLMQGIKVTSISKSALQNTKMIVPKSIEEQTKIGEYFSNLDNLITLHQRKCDEIKKLKKYMLQKMFPKNGEQVPEIRFEGFTDPWEQRKLGEVAKFRQGIQVDLENQYTEKADGRERFIRIVDYTQGTEDIRYIDEVENANHVSEDDVVVVRYGATAGFVGRGITGIIANNMFTINPSDCLDKKFLYAFMKQDKMYENLNSSNGSSAMPAINFGIMNNIDIVFPNTNEQRKIGQYFDNLDNLITLHQRKCDKLKEMKKYMLQNMFPTKE